jgi:hypothetical protein
MESCFDNETIAQNLGITTPGRFERQSSSLNLLAKEELTTLSPRPAII